MNREYKDKTIKGQMPLRLDSFYVESGDLGYFAEYDGWHFEGTTPKSVFNKILKYIFNGGEK